MREQKRPIFFLGNDFVEFADRNVFENKTSFFTWEEAMKKFNTPHRVGWRLPTKKEFLCLKQKYCFGYEKSGSVVFDNRLWLSAAGYCNKSEMHDRGFAGYYWTSERTNTPGVGWFYKFMSKDMTDRRYSSKDTKCSVRLVRTLPVVSQKDVLVKIPEASDMLHNYAIAKMLFCETGDFVFVLNGESVPYLKPSVIIPFEILNLKWHRTKEQVQHKSVISKIFKAEDTIYGYPSHNSVVIGDFGGSYKVLIHKVENFSHKWMADTDIINPPIKWAYISNISM